MVDRCQLSLSQIRKTLHLRQQGPQRQVHPRLYPVHNKLVLDTLDKALQAVPLQGRPNLILHSDQGFQFTPNPYAEVLSKNQVIHSVSYKGSCVDNVQIESWFSALKTESIYLYKQLSEERMIEIVVAYVKYYNEERFQEQLKELTPIQFRRLAL